jgi:hypothetical protein
MIRAKQGRCGACLRNVAQATGKLRYLTRMQSSRRLMTYPARSDHHLVLSSERATQKLSVIISFSQTRSITSMR